MHGIGTPNLTEAKGTVDRFLLSPDGDEGGLLLTDGAEVYFPPDLFTREAATVRPGSEVRVRGVRPHGERVVAAASPETAVGMRINAQKSRSPLFRQR